MECAIVFPGLLLRIKKQERRYNPYGRPREPSPVVALTPLPPRYTYRGMTRVSDKIYTRENLLYRYNSREFTVGIKVVLTFKRYVTDYAVCYVAKIAYFRFYKISLSVGIKNERGHWLILLKGSGKPSAI